MPVSIRPWQPSLSTAKQKGIIEPSATQPHLQEPRIPPSPSQRIHALQNPQPPPCPRGSMEVMVLNDSSLGDKRKNIRPPQWAPSLRSQWNERSKFLRAAETRDNLPPSTSLSLRKNGRRHETSRFEFPATSVLIRTSTQHGTADLRFEVTNVLISFSLTP